jgi:hypothetical protein
MIQHGVPLRKNPFVDLILIDKLPKGISSKDINNFEHDIKWQIQQEAPELCVRYYPVPPEDEDGQDLSKIVIYLGGC